MSSQQRAQARSTVQDRVQQRPQINRAELNRASSPRSLIARREFGGIRRR